MKITLSFFCVISCAMAMPAEVPFEALQELYLSKLTPNDVHVEPIDPEKKLDIPGSRIIGGYELAPHAAPYIAVVLTDIFCGGSLISSSAVLTTAHCTISASYVEVRLGAHHYTENEASQVRLTSSSVTNHALYDASTNANDIAIIHLPSAVTLGNYIKVVSLAPATASAYEGLWGLLAGWGRTTDASEHVAVEYLRGVYLYVIGNVECRSVYGSSRILDSHLCTSGVGIVGGCGGDIGGPLIVSGVQVGIASFFSSSCENGYPSGFTRISSFRSWITQYAGV